MAADALRVLGLAFSTGDPTGKEPSDSTEASMDDLVWVELVALADAVRPEASGVVRALHGAGIATFMITGDQAATARAIARNVGLGRHAQLASPDWLRCNCSTRYGADQGNRETGPRIRT